MGVREGLLALLDNQPRYGYELKTAFEATTGGVWALNIGQVYTTLDRLARDELVVEVGPGDDAGRRTYSITDDGRDELARWLDASPADAPPPRDELLLKVLLALATPSVDAQDVIQAQRVGIVEGLQAHRRRLRAQAGGANGLVGHLVVDALVLRMEADLRWLDLCEERLLAQTGTGSRRRTAS
ncbi:MAG TPA: PadR family transcriptional regulator [Solirubrobacteraceae bacterium]|jgi:DNA-binding PadR family transcriptional regulator|nr:PadR family transcriptional regulator [Solirubrobacteraceae bacterium]